MTVIKRVLSILFILGAISCTPFEVTEYERIHNVTFSDAEREALHNYTPPDTSYGVCGEWRNLALSVGFTADQWPTVNRLMWRESNCNPSAYNRSGASGLMQVMPMWADDCNGNRHDLFDPTFNLSCAFHVFNVQGWTAWSTY